MSQGSTVILVAIDDTPASKYAVETAVSLAERVGKVDLHLVHVVGPLLGVGGMALVPDPTQGDQFTRSRELLLKTRAKIAGMPVTTHALTGSPAKEVVRLAKELDCDIAVVGSHNGGTIERLLLGSVSDEIVRSIGCAVVVARPKDHRGTPVPRIEPPCPECIKAEAATAGKTRWCDRHSEHHARARVHYENPPTFGVGSTFIRPQD
jgi:nucleotide-binding universal stress UspA family protein